MKAYTQEAIDAATGLGASYADVRIIRYNVEGMFLRNGTPGNMVASETLGAGIRVLVNGAWGFAATNQVSNESLKATAKRAVEIATASSTVKTKEGVILAPKKPVEDIWCTPFAIDPLQSQPRRQAEFADPDRYHSARKA